MKLGSVSAFHRVIDFSALKEICAEHWISHHIQGEHFHKRQRAAADQWLIVMLYICSVKTESRCLSCTVGLRENIIFVRAPEECCKQSKNDKLDYFTSLWVSCVCFCLSVKQKYINRPRQIVLDGALIIYTFLCLVILSSENYNKVNWILYFDCIPISF